MKSDFDEKSADLESKLKNQKRQHEEILHNQGLEYQNKLKNFESKLASQKRQFDETLHSQALEHHGKIKDLESKLESQKRRHDESILCIKSKKWCELCSRETKSVIKSFCTNNCAAKW